MKTKSGAIQIVNEYLRKEILNNHNTHFANINKAKDVWWLNIPPEKFSSDLHLILKKEASFLWLKIESHTFNEPEAIFKLRTDNRIDLEISSDENNNYMVDIKSGGTNHNFNPYFEHEFNCTT